MTITLILDDPVVDPSAPVLVGGLPDIPAGAGFTWPRCATCFGALTYLGRIPHPVDPSLRLLVFKCENRPGQCHDWRAFTGDNRVMAVPAGPRMVQVTPPDPVAPVVDDQWSGHPRVVDASSYPAARDQLIATGMDPRQILGCLGGEPAWVQTDETPLCPDCGEPMILAAQLEEGPRWPTALNFGGRGTGYVFYCAHHLDQAAFLWQCA